MRVTYPILRKSYKANRALVLKNQDVIDRLIINYRLQAAGRSMPQISQVTALRVWTEREAGWGLRQRPLKSFDTAKFLKARNRELTTVLFTQADLMQLLSKLTKPNGNRNGLSPTQAYALMEHGRTGARFSRFRAIMQRNRAIAKEEAQRVEAERLLEEREKYRAWRPEDSILGRNRGGESINRFR